MEQNKTSYTITVNASYDAIDETIQEFLKKKRFEKHNEDGNIYYQHLDGVWGERFLEYYINGNRVDFLVYVGKYKKPKALENRSVSNGSREEYKQKLVPLFNALMALNSASGQMGQAQAQNAQPLYYSMDSGQPQMYNDAVYVTSTPEQIVQREKKEKQENGTKAIVAFVVSLIGLVLPFIGFQFGLIVIITEFALATAGLNSSKKGFAITAFILGSVQIVFLIITYIYNMMTIFS